MRQSKDKHLSNNLTQYIFVLGLLALSFLWEIQVQAQAILQSSVHAKWDLKSNQHALTISLADLLTPGQRDMIHSGFTTFAIFRTGDLPTKTRPSSNEESPLSQISCTVKYDTWEDRYEVVRLDPPPPQTHVFKTYRDWAETCLTIEISEPAQIKQWQTLGTVPAVLTIRQSTADESAKIKAWLVKQQSGFMQGLYAHMLGNFQYQNSMRIKIHVSQLPDNTQEKRSDKTQGTTP